MYMIAAVDLGIVYNTQDIVGVVYLQDLDGQRFDHCVLFSLLMITRLLKVLMIWLYIVTYVTKLAWQAETMKLRFAW